MRFLVNTILLNRAPSEILETIVIANPVEMPRLEALGPTPDESLQNEGMNRTSVLYAVAS